MLREQGKDRKRERGGGRESLLRRIGVKFWQKKRGGRRANKGEDEGNEGVEGIGR